MYAKISHLRGSIAQLAESSQVLNQEAELASEGISIAHAVDFAEVYAFIHPKAEYADAIQSGSKRVWRVARRHVALTELFFSGRYRTYMLAPHQVELRNHLRHVRHGVISSALGSLTWGELTSALEREQPQLRQLKEAAHLLAASEGPTLANSGHTIEMVAQAIRVVEEQFGRLFLILRMGEVDAHHDARMAARELLEQHLSLTLSGVWGDGAAGFEPSRVEIESVTRMATTQVLIESMDRVRPESQYSNRIDAVASMLLLSLNERLVPARRAMVLVSHAKIFSQVGNTLLTVTVARGPDKRAIELPLVRRPDFFITRLLHESSGNLDRLNEIVIAANTLLAADALLGVRPDLALRLEDVLAESLSTVSGYLASVENLVSIAKVQETVAKALAEVGSIHSTTYADVAEIMRILSESGWQDAIRRRLNDQLEEIIERGTIIDSQLELLLPETDTVRAVRSMIASSELRSHGYVGEYYLPRYAFVRFESDRLNQLALALVRGLPLSEAQHGRLVRDLLDAFPTASEMDRAFWRVFALVILKQYEGRALRGVDRILRELEDASGTADGPSWEVVFLRGLWSRLSGEYDAAIAALERCVLHRPDDPRYLKELAASRWLLLTEGFRTTGEVDRAPIGLEEVERAYRLSLRSVDEWMRAQIIVNYIHYLMFAATSESLRKAQGLVIELATTVPETDWYPEYHGTRGELMLRLLAIGVLSDETNAIRAGAVKDLEIAALMSSKPRDRRFAANRLDSLMDER